MDQPKSDLLAERRYAFGMEQRPTMARLAFGFQRYSWPTREAILKLMDRLVTREKRSCFRELCSPSTFKARRIAAGRE